MKKKNLVQEYLIITFATFLVSIAVYFFLIPSHLSIGSISGLAIVLANFIPLNVSMITLILNVAIMLLGYLTLGRDFGIKTAVGSVLLPAFLAIWEVILPNQQSILGDPLGDMLGYCFSVNIGLTILFNCNASSGGIDTIAKILNKYLRMDLGNALSVVGMLMAASSILVYDLKTVIFSVMGTYICGLVLDHYIFGTNPKRRVCVISKKEDALRDFILHDLRSGATLYQAWGAYDEQPHREIITIVDKNEYIKLMNYLSKNDPDAFVTVYSVQEVLYKPKY